jgi:hypothetical protein
LFPLSGSLFSRRLKAAGLWLAACGSAFVILAATAKRSLFTEFRSLLLTAIGFSTEFSSRPIKYHNFYVFIVFYIYPFFLTRENILNFPLFYLGYKLCPLRCQIITSGLR